MTLGCALGAAWLATATGCEPPPAVEGGGTMEPEVRLLYPDADVPITLQGRVVHPSYEDALHTVSTLWTVDGSRVCEAAVFDTAGVSTCEHTFDPGTATISLTATDPAGGTASASEILAGALQDDGRSPLIGTQTFGKGLIQSLIPLGDGSGLAVTVARYVTPSGRDIQNQGISPDVPLSGTEPLNPGGEGDDWLEQAQRLLVQQLDSERSAA